MVPQKMARSSRSRIPGLVCPNMKKTTLRSVHESLRDGKYDIQVDEDIRLRAKTCLDRMLAVAT